MQGGETGRDSGKDSQEAGCGLVDCNILFKPNKLVVDFKGSSLCVSTQPFDVQVCLLTLNQDAAVF